MLRAWHILTYIRVSRLVLLCPQAPPSTYYHTQLISYVQTAARDRPIVLYVPRSRKYLKRYIERPGIVAISRLSRPIPCHDRLIWPLLCMMGVSSTGHSLGGGIAKIVAAGRLHLSTIETNAYHMSTTMPSGSPAQRCPDSCPFLIVSPRVCVECGLVPPLVCHLVSFVSPRVYVCVWTLI